MPSPGATMTLSEPGVSIGTCGIDPSSVKLISSGIGVGIVGSAVQATREAIA